MRSHTACISILVLSTALATPAVAADHGIAGDNFQLRDPANDLARRVGFRASNDFAIDPLDTADPRTVGATLEIMGNGAGDGSTGVIMLDSSLWTGLGNPPGSKGYKFMDRDRLTGIRRVSFRTGRNGGSLMINGGGTNWPYDITQAQGPIDVRFTIGTDVYCANFITFDRNEPGRVAARNSPSPGSCTPGACGNGVVDGIEECDDGGTSPGDGCSATCQLESVNPAVCAGIPTSAGPNLATVRIATGLEGPVHIAAPRLDPRRVFIVEQPGRIVVVRDGVQLGAPFLNIEGIVLYGAGGEQGLLSVAFDPDYETNRFFYVYYTNNSGNLQISRFETNAGDPDDGLEASEHPIVTIPHPGHGNHNGGNLNFGPDGFLYAATGDGGGGGDPDENAQDDLSMLGKLLQIDVDTDTVVNWAKGLRNPFRFSFDRLNGDLYVGDVGQGSWEEISYDPAPVTAGVNYGWDDMEGRHCFEPPVGCMTAGRVLPVLEYCNQAHSEAACSTFQTEKGQAVIGGFVYRGCAMPFLQGNYFYSDTYNTWIKTFQGVSGGDAQNVVDRSADLDPAGPESISVVTSFGEDARGELYVTDYGDGDVWKIIPE